MPCTVPRRKSMETPSRALTPGNDLLTSLMDRMISEPPAAMAHPCVQFIRTRLVPPEAEREKQGSFRQRRNEPFQIMLILPLGRIETRDGVLVDREERNE